MSDLYTTFTKKENLSGSLSDEEKASVLYHDIFDYPLNFSDLVRWKSGKQIPVFKPHPEVVGKRGFYYLEGREGLIYKRLLKKRISVKKMKIAKKAAKILSLISGVKMIAVTGSLAMENSGEQSDIDLMIVTKKNLLWTTRLFAYIFLNLSGIRARSPGKSEQKDKLCLNIWLDENDTTWPQKDRNLYTAHEIAQIVPLVNKDKTFQKLLYKNKWVLKFWPSSVKIVNCKLKIENSRGRAGLLEQIAYKIQLGYMRSRITREVVTPTRAIFHPQDWGKIVLKRLA